MKKQIFLSAFASLCLVSSAQVQPDSTHVVRLDEVNIYSNKETNPQQTPVSSTILTPKLINAAQITSIKDMSGLVPNFYIPDYGSAMSSAVYIRGIGSRNSGQSMALYVDNVPYFEKSTFDFDFYDIRQIEVLRGAQGTLYGRNAMGGIVNIYTLSPFNYEGTKLSVSGGNHGFLSAQASHYKKFNNNFGLSVSGYYNHDNGFLTNQYTHKSADNQNSAGGRAKLDWNVSPDFKAQYSVNFDYIDQTAFPYGLYNDSTKKTAKPNFNDENSYTRKILTNSLFLQYKTKNVVLSSTSSHQYFTDDMKMDNDFSPKSYYTVEQAQKQHAWNEEIILKSNTNRNYQWSFGVNGFWQQLDLNAPFDFKKDGLTEILQPNFPPFMTITDTVMKTPGTFNTNTIGGAIFHQSTINNLLIEGLSVTAGLRLDYEKVKLDYNTGSSLNVNMKMGNKTIPYTMADTLNSILKVEFSELLPKLALKYEWSNRQFVYATVSKGYKTGGFNVQMFADLVSKGLEDRSVTFPDVVSKTISYKPEYIWNYEIGGQCLSFDNHLKSSISLFYINVNDMQLTQFVPNGLGRMISNAGEVVSKGVEVSFEAKLGYGFSATLNYGFANATFTNYKDSVVTIDPITHKTVIDPVSHIPVYTQADYKGKFVPYAPQNTLNLSGTYEHSFKNACIDRLMATVQYTGVGKIYWTEANDVSQVFYSLVNAKVAVSKGAFGLELWAKNMFNTQYNAFYFYSKPSTFYQIGKPLQLGATLKMEF